MKKTTSPQTQDTKTQKKLFGIAVDQLKAVYGGEGAVSNKTGG